VINQRIRRKMSDLYEQYEGEFSRKTAQIRDKISRAQTLQGERKKGAIQETQKHLEDAKQILQRMEQCTKNETRERARKLEPKNRGYSSDLARLQRELEHSSLVAFPMKDESAEYDYQVKEIDQRARLLSTAQKLDTTSDRLQNAHRIAIETEDIGTDVLADLGNQRQQLERTRDTLGIVNDNITKSRRILTSMGRRVATNKMILAFIIVILLAAIGLIVYFKWISKLV